MNSKTYDYLHNENDETINGDNECILRSREKSSLKLRLSRVFSSGNLKSPKNSGHFTFSDSRNSSPGQSPTIKLRYSWQTSSTASETSPKSRKSSTSSFSNSSDSSKLIWQIENVRQQLEQPVYSETDSRKSARGNTDKNTTQDLFELLERVQSSRLDDQRCVLPPYFTQLNIDAFKKNKNMKGEEAEKRLKILTQRVEQGEWKSNIDAFKKNKNMKGEEAEKRLKILTQRVEQDEWKSHIDAIEVIFLS
ncbi:hypothetical protein PV327_005057 [Microctonus hyperodae]|uniref:Uncharacterized protein n=1 Tax=Microctonus hyperodae TaxID=165561 RepID=A0AA39KZE6_MICHY|nr:hypothetical protein PV327_005057 [Microctonus hyperodae]